MSEEGAVAALRQAFEGLSPSNLDALMDAYAPDARFKDPFNDVRGRPAVRAIFEHMYVKLDGPRFKVVQTIHNARHVIFIWDFYFRFKGQSVEQCIHGASHIALNDALQVALHRDYWDPAEELYEKLPLLGPLMRWLKRRAAS
jgi:steroid Delta-isomerase